MYLAQAAYLSKELKPLFTTKKRTNQSRISLVQNSLNGDAYSLSVTSKEIQSGGRTISFIRFK